MPFPFPSSPMRLLREQWAGATELAQELYAMFTAKGPIQIDDQVEIAAPPGTTALRIVERERSATELNLGSVARSRSTQAAAAARSPRPAAGEEGARPRPAFADEPRARAAAAAIEDPARRPVEFRPGQPYQSPLFSVDGPARFGGPPVQFEQAPLVWDNKKGEFSPFGPEAAGTTPSDFVAQTATVTLGLVISGTGDTYRVQLYPAGSRGPAGATVTVFIPQIAAGEEIPAGTWLSSVYAYGDGTHECQVPVFLFG